MKFFARLNFFIGLLIVFAIVAGLFLFLNYNMSNVSSQKATLEADSYMVSSDYGGALNRQFIAPGDKVAVGDRLFEISSPSLTQAIRNNQIEEESPLFELSESGSMILLATAPGTVQRINFSDGSYIEARSDIASIETNNARYIVAYYLLNAPDYGRINRDSPVQITLPDNTKMEAKVFDINLEQDGERLYTVVRARLPEDADILPTFTPGTPVSTSWQLDNSDWQDTLFNFVRLLFEPQTNAE